MFKKVIPSFVQDLDRLLKFRSTCFLQQHDKTDGRLGDLRNDLTQRRRANEMLGRG
jgi:hypothetical protein